MSYINEIVSNIVTLEKAIIKQDIEKARSGIYTNTPENRKLGRVGRQYGGKKEEVKEEGFDKLFGNPELSTLDIIEDLNNKYKKDKIRFSITGEKNSNDDYNSVGISYASLLSNGETEIYLNDDAYVNFENNEKMYGKSFEKYFSEVVDSIKRHEEIHKKYGDNPESPEDEIKYLSHKSEIKAQAQSIVDDFRRKGYKDHDIENFVNKNESSESNHFQSYTKFFDEDDKVLKELKKEVFSVLKIKDIKKSEDNDIEKSKKHPVGTVVTRQDGQKYKKVSETGNSAQDWKLVTGDKNKREETEEERTKNGEQGGTEVNTKDLPEQAKNTSETALQNAIKQSPNPEVRQAAHQELERRKSEEVSQKELKEGESKEDDFEGNEFVEKFRTLPDEQVKFYIDSPYSKVKEAAKQVVSERGLNIVSKEEYYKQFKDFYSDFRDNDNELHKIREESIAIDNEVFSNPSEENLKKQEETDRKLEEVSLNHSQKHTDLMNDLNKFYEQNGLKSKEYLSKNKEIFNSVEFYKGDGFKEIRDFITYPGDKNLSKEISNISKFINDNKIDIDLSLNRRVMTGGTFFHKLNEGDIYEDKSFSSTSLVEISAFGDFNIKILAKAGSTVSNLGDSNEFEYLIDKGSKFRVLEKVEMGIIVELL